MLRKPLLLCAITCSAWATVSAQVDPLLERARPAVINPDKRVEYPSGVLSGTVVDSKTKEPLVGAIVRIQNANIGAVTDTAGRFTLRLDERGTTVVAVSYTGYASKVVVAVPSAGPVIIPLIEGEILTEEVVISASRVPQQLKEASVSITKLSMADISRSPTLNVYESLQQVKELEGLNVGIGYKVYNARGFLALVNNRFLQRYDGVDMLIPGNNATVGNLVGIPDVDVQGAEILVGSASVLYGSTAINGLLNITSRSAHDYTGLTGQLRVGVNQLGNSVNQPAAFQELGIRYATVLKKGWAYKMVLSAFRGEDWAATNTSDGANYLGTTNDRNFAPGVGNPGYDGTSVFGDEAFVNFSFLNFNRFQRTGVINPVTDQSSILRVARSGYRETDLVDYNFFNAKGLFNLSRRLRNNQEFNYTLNLGVINSMTPLITRDELNNFVFQHHKLEFQSPRLTVRAYASLQSNPQMVNLTAAGWALNNAAKSDVQWLAQYLSIYGATNADVNAATAGLPGRINYRPGSDEDARLFANANNSAIRALDPRVAYFQNDVLLVNGARQSYFDGGARLEPGTPAFDRALDSVRNRLTRDGGARIADYTSYGNLEWQYALIRSSNTGTFDLNIGGSYRNYWVRSFGSFYSDDSTSGFSAYEYGMYANALSRIAGGGIVLNLSARVDGNQSISPVISPRFAATFNVDKGRIGFIRLSAQRTYRLPNLVQQFQDLNLGVYRQIGPSRGVPERLGITGTGNNFTLASIQSYTSTFLTGNNDVGILRTYDITALRPELVTSYEFGFRTTMAGGTTYLDFALFYNQFEDFIGLVPLVGLRPGVTTSLDANFFIAENLTNYQVWTNISDRFTNYGYSIGADLAFSNKVRLNTNASFIWFQGQRESNTVALVDLYNTPIFKANTLLALTHIYRNFNVSVNHRWSDTYEFQVPSFSTRINAFNVVDMAISYDFPGYQVKLGGNNVLNHYHEQIIFGPSIGASYFVQLTFDPYLYPRNRK